MGIVYLLLHKGGLCHVHLAQSVQLGNEPVLEAPASVGWFRIAAQTSRSDWTQSVLSSHSHAERGNELNLKPETKNLKL